MVHDDYKEMIPVRALSALDTAEDRALSEHLSSCAECRRELEGWQNTSAALALMAEPLEPSPRVREQILAKVREEARPKESSRVVQFPARKNVWSSIGNLGALAAAIAFVALMVAVFVLWRDNRNNQSIIAAMQVQLQQAQTERQSRDEAMKIITAAGTRFAPLKATNMAPGATATLAYDKTGHAMLVSSGLPAAPQGMGYQLWFIAGDKAPMPGKVFSPDRTGIGMVMDDVPAEAREAGVFAITLEPMPSGSQQPTSKIYLSS